MARITRTAPDIPAFADYRHYKPLLRTEFRHRCAYCEITEAALMSVTAFGVDHFRPRRGFPELDCVYTNLYYCCNNCIRYKGQMWPPEDLIAKGYSFPDPCQCGPHREHLREDDEGHLDPLTNAGAFLLDVLRLNRQSAIRFRQRRTRMRQRIQNCRAELRRLDAPPEITQLLEQVLQGLEAEYNEYFYEPGHRE